MNRVALIAAALLLLLTSSSAFAKRKTLENVTLAYIPTTTLGDKEAVDLTGMLKTKIRLGEFADRRSEKKLIGENREKADKGKVLPVSTRDDVAAWIKARFSDELGRYGLSVVDSGGDVVLSGEVRRFFVTEDSTYGGDVGILITLTDASGKELWQGMANGAATRWGRSYKLENYQEAWSDSLFEAIYSLMENPEFRKALGGR